MISKLFPWWLHLIVTTTVIGYATALHDTSAPLTIQYPVTGMAAGLGATFIIRIFFS